VLYHFDVVSELAASRRRRQDASFPGRHVAREEVESAQRNAGVVDGVHEVIDVAALRTCGREGPPEFDGGEAGLRRGLWAFEQGQLGKDDRTVNRKP
jgi:hypothetical protein